MPWPIVEKNEHDMFPYTIVDADRGEVLEHLENPIGNVHGGAQHMFDKADKASGRAAVGDEIELTLAADETFADADPALVFCNCVENVPPQFHRLGAQVKRQGDQGETRSFAMTRIEDAWLTIDGNSPLVEENQTSKATIDDILDASANKMESESPSMPSLH